MSIHWHTIGTGLFGWPGTWGTGGNMVAWVICGTLGFGWLHGKEKARHIQKMAQSAQHHRELLEQAEKHHHELTVQASRQHAQLLAQADANHQMLTDKLAAVADRPVSGGAGSNPASEGFPADEPVVPPPATTRARSRKAKETPA